jgi:serine/threonine-protein kinase
MDATVHYGDDEREVEELVLQCLDAEDPVAELERRTADRQHLRATGLALLQQVGRLQRADPLPPGGGDPDPEDPRTWPEIPDVQLDALVGRGGQGVVFRARQTYLVRTVAVKVLAAELRTAKFVDRFRREARMLAGLQHPHIVTCHQAGLTEAGECYLVMEFIEGPTLRAWADAGGRVPLEQALRMARDLAQALEHAHGLGFVHRDVKPENVLLQPVAEAAGGAFPFVPKLADLGLARPVQSNSEYTMLTPVGAVIGTPVTMAPEQFDAPERVDHRADIYGLGCVLYFALAGRPPFRGPSLTALIEQKAAMRAPGGSIAIPGVPRAVGALIARMLAYDPAQRPQSYADLIAELDGLRESLAPAAPRRWVGPVVVGALILGGLAWAFTASGAGAVTGELVVAAPDEVTEGAHVALQATLPSGVDGAPVWHGEQIDGAAVALRAKGAGRFEFTVPRGTAGTELAFALSAGPHRREVGMRIAADPAAAPLAPGIERALFAPTGDDVMARWIGADPVCWMGDESGRGASVNTPHGRTEAKLVLPRGPFELHGRIEPRWAYVSRELPQEPIAETGFRMLLADCDALALLITPAGSRRERFRAALCRQRRGADDGAWETVAVLDDDEGQWTGDDPLRFMVRWDAGFSAALGKRPAVEVRPAAEWQVPWVPGLLVVHADRGTALLTDWVLAGPRP